MSAAPIIPLGIDNVMFSVRDLGAAIAFYARCGFVLKFRIDQRGIALFSIGDERPGLMLRVEEAGPIGRLWVEVSDAQAVATTLADQGLPVTVIETAAGTTVEASDPSGNVIGFADYTRRPELARQQQA